MIKLFNFYKSMIRTSLIELFQYRVSTYTWLVGKVLEPIVFLIIWTTIAQTNNGSAYGLKTNFFIIYYIVLMIVSQFTFTDLIWRFGEQVENGDFSNKLLLPVHPIHYDIAENAGYKIFSMPIIIIAAVITAIFFKVELHLTAVNIILFILTLFFAYFIRFLFEWSVALTAFWFINVKGISALYYILLIFFSGRAIPLNIFPSFIKNIADILPFKYMIYFPIEVLLNNAQSDYILKSFMIMTGWLIFLSLFAMNTYRIAIKRYTAVGG